MTDVLVIQDLHLKERTWVNRYSVAGDSFYALSQVRDYAQENNIKHIVLLGDIFDCRHPDSAAINAFSDFCKSLHTDDVSIYCIQGNHDYWEDVPLFAAFGCIDLSGTTVDIGGHSFYGIDYTKNRESLLEALANVPEVDYLCLHEAFRHLLPFESAWKLEIADIPDYVHNVLSGHIHTQDMTDEGGVKVYSAGSTYPTDWDGVGKPHGMLHIKDVPEFVQLDTRLYIKHVMDSDDSRDAIKLDLEEKNKETLKDKPVLSPVVLIDRVDELVPLEQDKYPGLLLLDAPRKRASIVDTSAFSYNPEEGITLRSGLPQVLDKEKQPDEYSLIDSLLEADSPRDFLNKWLSEEGVVTQEK
jgi:DNA repair exonuclease SbcCD nuclease subunit